MDEQSGGAAPAWARLQGHVSLGQGKRGEVSAQEAADRFAILDTIGRYAWSYDERDLDALAGVFTEDAVWVGDVMGSVPIGPISGRDDIVEWLHGHMKSQTTQRRHCTMNPVVTSWDGATAQVQTYLLLFSAPSGTTELVTTGFYRFDLVKQPTGEWLISHLFGGFDAPF
ncbi:nuclear transport factor 2 family protein [Streptomyces sp. NPDC047061]|uniref:nuclear transport factor 2 family protein n=1 Tax=Streptomyces sp. NPDC047061 TaxID=3154605 RepID=UPI0033DDC6AA